MVGDMGWKFLYCLLQSLKWYRMTLFGSRTTVRLVPGVEILGELSLS